MNIMNTSIFCRYHHHRLLNVVTWYSKVWWVLVGVTVIV